MTPVPTTAAPLVVPFRGERAVTAPMAWAQLNIWEWMTGADRPISVLELAVPVPVKCTVDDLVASLAVLLARHEGLRTLYAEGGERTQWALDAGEPATPDDFARALHDAAHSGTAATDGALGPLAETEPSPPQHLPIAVAGPAGAAGHGDAVASGWSRSRSPPRWCSLPRL